MKLIVLFWSDGSRNVFDSSRDIESFIEWKKKKYIDAELTFERKEITKEEYKTL